MPYNYRKLLKKENFSGHINYSAPEMILEDKNFEGKIDVWSLGCCLYYLHTKCDPFEGRNPEAIKYRILNEYIYKNHSISEQIIKELLDLSLTVVVDKRPDATQLLEHQDKLEIKHFGKIVSKSDHSNRLEEEKSLVFGSPQSNYKQYNTNYLPPASVKNRKMKYPKSGKATTSHSFKTNKELKKDREYSKEANKTDETSKVKDSSISPSKIDVDTKNNKLSDESLPDESNSPTLDRQEYLLFQPAQNDDYSWFDKDHMISYSENKDATKSTSKDK